MKLLGKDITPAKVMAFVEERLAARGLAVDQRADVTVEGVEVRVDPLSFNLQALEENADATRGLPLETHRDGLGGRVVVFAKRVFRTAGQLFINEALGRQRVFNGHVRDSYAQLSAEVMRLRARVAELERAPAGPPVEPARAPKPPPPPVRAELPRPAPPKPPPTPTRSDSSRKPLEPKAKPRTKPVPPPPPSAPRARNTRRGK